MERITGNSFPTLETVSPNSLTKGRSRMQKRVISSGIARNGARIALVSRHTEGVPMELREYGVEYSAGEMWITYGKEGLTRAYNMALTLFNNPSLI
jgi:hypothetical protein